jgi:hypothetical protein
MMHDKYQTCLLMRCMHIIYNLAFKQKVHIYQLTSQRKENPNLSNCGQLKCFSPNFKFFLQQDSHGRIPYVHYLPLQQAWLPVVYKCVIKDIARSVLLNIRHHPWQFDSNQFSFLLHYLAINTDCVIF